MNKKKSSHSDPQRVVVLGGGFGGVHTLLGLRGLAKKELIEVTLISREDHFLFTPLLHEVASGKIHSKSAGISISDFAKGRGITFIKAEVLSIDLLFKKVQTNLGLFAYDSLVIALGSSVNRFGVCGAESLPALKTLYDGEYIKELLVNLMAELKNQTGLDGSSETRKARIVIIGGGATGVEIAAEIADIFKPHKNEKIQILLLEAGGGILSNTTPRIKEVAERSLEKRGVQIMLGSSVARVQDKYIELPNGDRINFDLAIWTAGVKAADISLFPEQPKSNTGRLKVLSTLQLENYPCVFALGDIAGDYPMTAEVAVSQARIVAENIEAHACEYQPSNFVYKSKGMLLSLGRWMAGAEVKIYLLHKVLYFWGFTAWWVWHIVYISKIPGIRNKARIVWDWVRTINKTHIV